MRRLLRRHSQTLLGCVWQHKKRQNLKLKQECIWLIRYKKLFHYEDSAVVSEVA